MDQAAIAWDTMLVDANQTAPAVGARRDVRDLAIGAIRTIGMLVVVGLAILVALPAMIAAQPTFLG